MRVETRFRVAGPSDDELTCLGIAGQARNVLITGGDLVDLKFGADRGRLLGFERRHEQQPCTGS